MAEEPILQHLRIDTTWAGAAGEACRRLCDALLKAVDRHRLQAVGGSDMSIKVLLRWHTGGRMLLAEHINDGATRLGIQIPGPI
jgi:hypothetical protein